MPRETSPANELSLGALVRCERAHPSRGTWNRYAGRTGRVVAYVAPIDEYAIAFGSSNDVSAWFKPNELTEVSDVHRS
jgi:hypothetical protein